METLRVARAHLVAHPLPRDRGGPHPLQLQSMPLGGRAERVEETPHAGSPGTLALLVGGRPQLRRADPQ